MAEVVLTLRDRELIAANLCNDTPKCPRAVRPGSWGRLLRAELDYVDYGEWMAIWDVLPEIVRWGIRQAPPTAPNFEQQITKWQRTPSIHWNPADWVRQDQEQKG